MLKMIGKSDDKPQASTTEAPKQKLDTGQDIPF